MSQRPYTPPAAGTWRQEHTELGKEFDRWGIAEWSATPNVPMDIINRRFDHRDERAVTIVFKKDDVPVTLAMSDYDSPPLNLKVLRLCIADMRMIEKRGVSETMRSAFLQLGGPTGPVKRDPYEVLGIRPNATAEDIEDMYRLRAKRVHPDTGGSAEAFKELNEAYEEAKRRLS